MTLAQALIALAEGKKVRHPVWHEDIYIHLSGNSILDNFGFQAEEKLVRDDWELYVEPKKTVKVTEWLVDFGAGVLNIEHQLCTEEQAKAAWPSAKLTPLRSFEVEDV